MSSSCVPCSAMRPSSSTMSISAPMTVVTRCEMMSLVTPDRFSPRRARIFASVSLSTAERESSKTSTGVLRMRVRAMETRCFCPPERVTPRSPTSVAYPSGKAWICSSTQARCAARRTASSPASGAAMAIFSPIVREKRKPSCNTKPTAPLTVAGESPEISFPPIVILPEVSG